MVLGRTQCSTFSNGPWAYCVELSVMVLGRTQCSTFSNGPGSYTCDSLLFALNKMFVAKSYDAWNVLCQSFLADNFCTRHSITFAHVASRATFHDRTVAISQTMYH